MDPGSNTFVVILANAVHPRGNPPISPLRGEIATAAAQALHMSGKIADKTADNTPVNTSVKPDPLVRHLTDAERQAQVHALRQELQGGSHYTDEDGVCQIGCPATLTGIDVLESTHFDALADAAQRHNDRLRIGLLTNQSGLDSKGNRTVDVLFRDATRAVAGLSLTTLFSPEHGLFGVKDTTKIANGTDPSTHLPILSLYGAKPQQRHPSPDSLKNLDAVVIDLQDAGVRFYTYEAVVGYFLEAAAQEKAHGHDLEIIILDRPNPIGGVWRCGSHLRRRQRVLHRLHARARSPRPHTRRTRALLQHGTSPACTCHVQRSDLHQSAPTVIAMEELAARAVL